ncbi:MAG: MgtC/SapB family protein [Lachnospira sp.]|nr:MgtC/SapB family protein [Lachnospira sp.]MDD5829482.1 DUF4956 domain-containing protein [Lachnospira sp.]
MFETIFTTTTENSINISQSILAVVVAVIIGLVIGVTYMLLCKKEGYQKNFIFGLIIIPAVVTVVIMLVGSNVARAFSMAGAFALVRFRSAPGSAKDIAVVFFSMAVGLACGLGYITFAACFAVIILLVMVALTIAGIGSDSEKMKQLRITIPEDLNYNSIFDDLFEKYTEGSKLNKVKTTNMGTMYELTYNIKLKNSVDEKEFIDNIRMRNGNLNITMNVMPDNSAMLN